jgi:hypothetical protein
MKQKTKNQIQKPSYHNILKEWEGTPVKTFTRTHKSPKYYDRKQGKRIVKKMLTGLVD